MLSVARLRLLLALAALAVVSSSLLPFRTAWADNVPARPANLRPGLDPDEVIRLLGQPSRVSRQIFSHHSREQWLYGPPHHLRLLFDCPRGQKPRLQWARPIPALAP